MKKILSTALLFVLAVFLVGCSDHGDSVEMMGPQVSELISFATDIQPVFNSNCVGCHGEGGNGGLDLRPGLSFGNLVNIASNGGPGNRVEPGDAASSFLYQRLSYSGGTGMPPIGQLPISTVELVAEWINDGANNN